jgi:primosomal protein N' (replication factor Y)
MDTDSTAKRGSHKQILGDFRKHKIDILIGTQMIAKGHDFPRVMLVGVISADTALNLPDFRAGERTFNLLTQVAGRAGRGEEPGTVIIQTFSPTHYADREEHNA